MRLQAVLIPVILEISSMSLNSEASRVLFLNQTFLKIEKYMKNGQPSLMDNLPSNTMFRYVLIFSERKSSGCTYMIVKHEFWAVFYFFLLSTKTGSVGSVLPEIKLVWPKCIF